MHSQTKKSNPHTEDLSYIHVGKCFCSHPVKITKLMQCLPYGLECIISVYLPAGSLHAGMFILGE